MWPLNESEASSCRDHVVDAYLNQTDAPLGKEIDRLDPDPLEFRIGGGKGLFGEGLDLVPFKRVFRVVKVDDFVDVLCGNGDVVGKNQPIDLPPLFVGWAAANVTAGQRQARRTAPKRRPNRVIRVALIARLPSTPY